MLFNYYGSLCDLELNCFSHSLMHLLANFLHYFMIDGL
jgi:hypothetical protein